MKEGADPTDLGHVEGYAPPNPITDEQVEKIYKDFFFRLPEYMQDALTSSYKVA